MGPDEVNVGDNISLSCTAENSNPPADVSILINGNPPPGVTFEQTKTPDGGFTTVTNLASYVVGPTERDLKVTCYAANAPLGKTEMDTKIIIVKRKFITFNWFYSIIRVHATLIFINLLFWF